MLMVEAFCVYGWKTFVLDVLICPEAKYGVCQAEIWAIIHVMLKSKMAATETSIIY